MKHLISVILLFITFSPLTALEERDVLGQVGFDQLRIENIIIGIEPYERVTPQDLLIDMRVTFDLNSVAEVDDLESTVDYVKLGELATEIASNGEYCFIDVLGLDILKQVFITFPEVEKGCIRIQKESAIPAAKSGGLVEISLTRNELLESTNENKLLGKIGFDQLLVHTIIGDLPIERANEQDLLVDVRVTIDLKTLSETGELQSTVNYVEMANLFDEIAKKGQYQMIETLAVKYLNRLYERYPKIEEAYIQIKKPGTLPNYPFKTDAVTELRR